MSSWLIYGATGYTGRLIAREAARQGLSPILAGRNALAIETLGKQLGLPARVLLLDHPAAVAANLSDVALVLNCAGPFIRTAEPLLHACLSNHVHYLDISGEIATLERAQELDSQAVVAGIVICSGVGFDVIPTDCVAAMLKEALPEATELALGFESTQRLSPGTAKTMIEHLAEGGKVRRDGRIESVPFGYGVRRIDFGHGEGRAMAIPWGDVSTAFYTTGIPNITVYTRVTERQLWLAEILNAFRILFRSRTIRGYAQRRIEARVKGPSQATRDAGTTWVWGEARDRDGVTKTIRLTAPDAYALTVSGAIGAVRRVLEHPITGGSTTPARLLGSRYVLDLPGTSLLPGSV
jgi:short subunit dehydrogenase-like uncharacterized protein